MKRIIDTKTRKILKVGIELQRPDRRQCDWAEYFECSSSHFSAMLNGLYAMPEDMFQKLLDLLDVREAWLRSEKQKHSTHDSETNADN